MSIRRAIAKLSNDLARNRNLKGNRGPDGSLLSPSQESKEVTRIINEMQDTVFPEGGVASDANVVASVSKGINDLERLGYEAAGIPEDVLSAFLVASGKNKVDKKLVDKAKKGFDERLGPEAPTEYIFTPEGEMFFKSFNRKDFAKTIEDPKDREAIKKELIKTYNSLATKTLDPKGEDAYFDIQEALTMIADKENTSLKALIGKEKAKTMGPRYTEEGLDSIGMSFEDLS